MRQGRLIGVAVLLIFVAGCAAHHDPVPGGNGRTVQVLDVVLDARATQLLDKQCASCHGGASSLGGFSGIGDTAMLVAGGWVVIGNPDASPLYRAVTSGAMPPGNPLSVADTLTLHDWIAVALATASPVPTPTPTPKPIGVTILDATLHASAMALLTTECAGCHGPSSPGYGSFSVVTDVSALVAKGWVIPGNPAKSNLYKRCIDGTMPPGTGLDATQQTLVHDWIANALGK